MEKFGNGNEQIGFKSELPKEIRIIDKVEGGGDSLFESLHMVLEEVADHITADLPENPLELREEIVTYLIQFATKFNLKLDKHERRLLESMKLPGVMPREEVLLLQWR